jgi:hypothetical protein
MVFHGPKAVRCRVFTVFSHCLWTPECNAFCPETCPGQRCKEPGLIGFAERIDAGGSIVIATADRLHSQPQMRPAT